MIIKRKLFSNKEQKRLRRKWDLEQGRGTDYTSGNIHIEAQGQDKILGGKRTEELLEKGKKNSRSGKNFFGSRTRTLTAANQKELAEIEKAENLLRAGRERNRDNSFSTLYEKKNGGSKGKLLHERINRGEAGVFNRDMSGNLRKNISLQFNAEEAVQDSKNARLEKLAKESESAANKAKDAVVDQVKKKGFKLSRNQKIGAAVIGGTALVGTGVYAYKKHKKSKKEEDKK